MMCLSSFSRPPTRTGGRPPVPAAPQPTAGGRRSARTLGGRPMRDNEGVGAADVLLVIGLLARGCGGSSPKAPAPAGRTAARPAAAGDPTLDYWIWLDTLPAKIAPHKQAGPDRQVWALREVVREMR